MKVPFGVAESKKRFERGIGVRYRLWRPAEDESIRPKPIPTKTEAACAYKRIANNRNGVTPHVRVEIDDMPGVFRHQRMKKQNKKPRVKTPTLEQPVRAVSYFNKLVT